MYLARFNVKETPIRACFKVKTETIPAVFKIHINPKKLSQLQDDMNIENRFTTISGDIESLRNSENTEMTDIVSLLERRTQNMIDFNEL
jgi:hypothetical protein